MQISWNVNYGSNICKVKVLFHAARSYNSQIFCHFMGQGNSNFKILRYFKIIKADKVTSSIEIYRSYDVTRAILDRKY